MTRPLRVEYSGAYYHIINRGNSGEKVLGWKRDKEKFLEYLSKAADRFSLTVHGYCILDNHYHLIVETALANVSAAVQWLGISYASWYNRKHGRQGHVFQGRFKSYLVDADEYLVTLSRYIHLNPVRARIVKKPGEYAWSSYKAYVEGQSVYEWLAMDQVLEVFGSRKKTAQRKYREFVEDIALDEVENPNKAAIAGFIIGGERFVEWVQETFLMERSAGKEITQLRRLKSRLKPPPDLIVRKVSGEFGCRQEDILRRGRKGNTARDVAIYIACRKSDFSNTKLGQYFGGISGAGITVQCKRLEGKMQKDKRLRKRVEMLIGKIAIVKM